MRSRRYYLAAEDRFGLVVCVVIARVRILALATLVLLGSSPAGAQSPVPPATVVSAHCGSPDRTGAGSSEISKQLVECGYELTGKSDYRSAQQVFEDAVAMARQRSDPAALSEALGGLGVTLRTLGEPARAESVLLESLTLAEQLNDRSRMADAMSQLGRVRNMQARYDEAREYHLRSLELWSEIGDLQGVAVASNNVGAMYRASGDYLSALEYYERSLMGLREVGDDRHSATVLDNMGWIARRLGDSGRGLDLARQALAIREAFDDRQGIATSLGSLSQVYQAAGNYRAALDALGRSLDLRTSIGAVHAIAESLNNIAVVYEAQGDYPQAAAYLRRALALNQSKVGSTSLTAEIHTHLGDVLFLQGNDARAAQSLKRSLAISTAQGHKVQAAAARLSLARVYMKLGQTTLAARTLEECLAHLAAAGDRMGRAEALVEMAEVQRRRRHLTSGLRLATEATQLAAEMELPDVGWRALTVAGRIHLDSQHVSDARHAFDDAIAIVEDLRSLNPGGEESRRRFLAGRLAPFQERIRLALAESNTADAFHYAERSKARALLGVIGGDGLSSTPTMTAAERDRERTLRLALSSVNSEVVHAARALPRDVARIAGLKRKQVSTRLAYEDLQARLYAAHPDLRVRRLGVPIVQVAEAQHLLREPSAAIIEFAVALDRVTAFVITQSGLQAFELPIRIAQLNAEVTQFREQLAHRDLRAGDSARRLYGMVLGPMRAALQGKNELVIVPDAILWDLPFQALQSGPNRYVIEDAAVSYAPSVTVLRETMRRRPTAPASRTLLAFGNPASLASKSVPSLPDAEHEVETLALMYGASSRVYIGADASEERWKAEVPNYRVVHLAAHGVLDNSSPMYSHLELAAPAPGSAQDGLLEAWEIMNLQLGAELVVLSACETARGQIVAGEGVIGLMWALFVGGSPATLVSQWQVESKSSSALMIAFHRAWNAGQQGASKARALQLASLQLLRNGDTSHPFYWAGFVLVGDGR